MIQNGYLYTGGNPVMYADPSGNNFTMSETLTAMGIAATLQDVIVSSAYYMILAAEVGITLKLAREAYYAGAFAKLTNKMMEIYDEEEYIPIFVIDDVMQNIIIDTIPEVELFIEVFPEKEETGNQVILDPLPEQKTLWDVVMWGESGKTTEEFDIVEYGDKTPGLENHHGVLDIWATHNIDGYKSRASKSTTIALNKSQHDATKAVYRDWLFEKTGKKVGGKVDWTRVSPREIQALTERMFDAANVPVSARNDYYREFNRYIYGLGK